MNTSDREAIHDLLVRYADAADGRNYDLFSEVFLADATFGRDPVRTGLGEIVDFIRASLGNCGPTQHLLGNERYEFLTDDRAQVRCSVRAFHRGAGDRSNLVYEMLGDYHDIVVRTAEGWRIESRWLDARIRVGPRSAVLGLDRST